MRLVEYLFKDPGDPPVPTLGGGPNPMPGDPIAQLDGGFYYLRPGFTPSDAIYYRHVLFAEGVESPGHSVQDPAEAENRFQPSPALKAQADRARVLVAQRKKIKAQIAARKRKAKKTEDTDEGKKREHGSYDTRTLGKLKDGKYPGRAEDGKGFCFVCANGALHAFRWRGDALRWAQDEPREITKFWYGEPVSPSGKFRVRVRDRYRKDEAVQTFSSYLERRAGRL